MSSRQKTLEEWKHNTPRYAPVDTVRAIIKHYFGNPRQKGSHMKIKDKRLTELSVTGIAGCLDIPIQGGQRIKGFYLKKLVRAIELITGEEI